MFDISVYDVLSPPTGLVAHVNVCVYVGGIIYIIIPCVRNLSLKFGETEV